MKLQANAISEYQGMQLKKDFFYVDKDIYLCPVYIIPIKSAVQTDTTLDRMEVNERDINRYKNMGYVALCGDLNTRTGSEPDFIVDDNDSNLPLDDNYIEHISLPRRHCQDRKVDERGKQFINISISARLRILNGRTVN